MQYIVEPGTKVQPLVHIGITNYVQFSSRAIKPTQRYYYTDLLVDKIQIHKVIRNYQEIGILEKSFISPVNNGSWDITLQDDYIADYDTNIHLYEDHMFAGVLIGFPPTKCILDIVFDVMYIGMYIRNDQIPTYYLEHMIRNSPRNTYNTDILFAPSVPWTTVSFRKLNY